MLIDGINLVEGSSIINSHVEPGTTFPAAPSVGRMFYLTAASGGNDPGMYVYNGTAWITGDVTKIIAGLGLLGGGSGGDVTVGVDTSVIATVASVTALQSSSSQALSAVQSTLSSNISTVQSNLDTVAARNYSITGDATGSTGAGGTSTALTLANTSVTAGSYGSATQVGTFTVDSKGRLTASSNILITPAFSSLTGKPTTITGYGITDAQPLSADLTAIDALVGTSGFLKKTATDTWALDTNVYLTGNQVVTVTGDATGSGATTIALTLANSGVAAGTYKSVTVDVKGRVTAGSNPTTISGYGITDAVNKNGDTMIGSLVMPAGTHITVTDVPVNGTDATNKNYVDAAIAGLSWKQAVQAATTGNIALTGLQTIDGIALVAGDRVLVKAQTSGAENGIYVVGAGAWTRSTDLNVPGEFPGAAVLVEDGTVYANSAFVSTTQGTITVGTTPITFVQFNGASGVVAGIGLTKTGNTLDISLGAGIAELPSDEVGVDLHSVGGLILTLDGSTPSALTNAQVALSDTGVAAGTYFKTTVDVKGRVTAGTNPTTVAGFGITDAMLVGQTIDGGTF